MTFEEWRGDATEEDLLYMEKQSKKAMHKYFLLGLIPVLNFFFMGYAIFCFNTHYFIKTKGRSNGFFVFRWFMLLYGGLLLPLIIVNFLAKHDKSGWKVLGFK